MSELQRLQIEIEEEVKKYNLIAKEAESFSQNRATLYEQHDQNQLVLKEIEILPQEAKVFKQVGNILIEQSKNQAVHTLKGRLDFINNQLKSVEQLIKKNQSQQKAMVEKIQKAKQCYSKMSKQLEQSQ